MATTYSATRMATGVIPRAIYMGVPTLEISSFAITAAFVINDVVQFLKIASNPAITLNGPVIHDVILDVPDLDTSTGIVLDVGDSTTSGRYISGSTIGQTGGIARMAVAGSLGYAPFSGSYSSYTTVSYAEYTIQLKVTTAATGTAATTGTLKLAVTYTYDQ